MYLPARLFAIGVYLVCLVLASTTQDLPACLLVCAAAAAVAIAVELRIRAHKRAIRDSAAASGEGQDDGEAAA